MTPERPTVALIGPVLPFRGGIAQHTTMLHRALSQVADVRTFSFTRQYPKLLFPGESDRDPAFAGHVEPGVRYVIDSLNPLTWRAVVREIVSTGPAVVVIPWWTAFWAPCFSFIARRLRRAGIAVVFFCHNVVEHEEAAWKRAVTRRVLASGSAFAVHTRVDERNLREMFPHARVAVHPHPVYENFPCPTGALQREHDVELLFFGFVRPYKGLDVLVEALALVRNDLDWRLTVAGEFWQGSADVRARVASLGLDDRVEIVEGYLSDAEVAEYFGRAHALALPYRSATGSGVVAVAYNYGKPVIVTRVGGLPDVVVEGETGWIVEPDDPEALARAIEGLAQADIDAMARAVDRYVARNMTWSGLAHSVLDVAGTEV